MSESVNGDEPQRYATYRGLGYTPMIGGVPLFLALGLLGFVVFAMIFLIIGVPIVSLILIVLAMAVYFLFKVICENNNKAPLVFKMKVSGLIYKIKHGGIIKTDMGVENEKRKKFQRGFKRFFRYK